MFWHGNQLVWRRHKASFSDPIRCATEARFGRITAVLVVLDKQVRILSSNGQVTAVTMPGRIDHCWAMDEGVLVQGQGVWILQDILGGFAPVSVDDINILHVASRVIYRQASDVYIGRLVDSETALEIGDVTMFHGLAPEPKRSMCLQPLSKTRIQGSITVSSTDDYIYIGNGHDLYTFDHSGKETHRQTAESFAPVDFFGPALLLRQGHMAVQTQYGDLPAPQPLPTPGKACQMALHVLQRGLPNDKFTDLVTRLISHPTIDTVVTALRHLYELDPAPPVTSDPLALMMLPPRPAPLPRHDSVTRALQSLKYELFLGQDVHATHVGALLHDLGSSTSHRDLGLPRTRHVYEIQRRLSSDETLIDRCHSAVLYMLQHDLRTSWTKRLPPDILLPILEAIRVCRLQPRSSDPRFLARIGRRDLAHNMLKIAPQTRPARFRTDKRLDEVARIMQTDRTRSLDLPAEHVHMVNNLAHRTMATTVGNGAFNLGTKKIDHTKAIRMPPIETTIKLTSGLVKAAVDDFEWPRFHSGVATALAIDGTVDKSWILFCKPPQLCPEYAGLLLGLGLRGQLRLQTSDAFSLLETRHDMTTVGLLIGLAATHVSSRDVSITKALSLHTQAFLPMGSVDLNASTMVQAAGMLGLGLVHVKSQNMRMAKVACAEIKGDEGYAFASAMSLGLIMLRHPEETCKNHLQTLLSTIHGPSATLALGLMYLKSGTDVISMPESVTELDQMPPESLLYRTYARALICWDARPSADWVLSLIPSFVKEQTMAHMHILAGACMALGVKYAGTASEVALTTILRFHGILQRSAASGDASYEGRIRRRAARQGLDAIIIAICSVMSGTGETGILRRIRVAHGQEGAGITYGTHMALHLALGLLFMGKGHYTLGRTDLAIAAMTIAFFPRFSPDPTDNSQVFRHLWALAAEPRCLVARDVDTGRVENVPLQIILKSGGDQKLMSPTLVCPFQDIQSVEVDSVRYWPVTMTKFDTIHVQRKSAFLDYGSDNKGTRSIHARVGSLTGFDMHYDLVSAAAPPGIRSTDVRQLLRLHSTDPLMHGWADIFSSCNFSRSVLLECCVLDKSEAIVPYHILRAGVSESLARYYKAWPSRYCLHTKERTLPLIRAPFIAAMRGDTAKDNWREHVQLALKSSSAESIALRLYEAIKPQGKEGWSLYKATKLVHTWS